MGFDFNGKRVVVAGGSRGIGRSIALGFAQAGAAVSVCARNLEGLKAVEAELAGYDHPVHAAPCDLADGEAISAYIADLPADERHPFLARRGNGFRYAGAWSSLLRDHGFHVNHLHPQGWISSCYYVTVPEETKDTDTRNGWIKFGEPSLAVPLENAVRHAVQPVPGRLVLFPSYMWHGTVPLRAASARTTIAFDALPGGTA